MHVTRCALAGRPCQLPRYHGPLSRHSPLGNVPPFSTEAVIYGVVVNDNLYTWAAT